MGEQLTRIQIDNRLALLRPYYERFHSQCAIEEMYYNLDFAGDVNSLPDFEIRIPPTATNAIDTLVDNIDTPYLLITVPPTNQTEAAGLLAEKKRKFYIGNIFRIEMEHGPIISEAAKSMALYGCAFVKTVFDGDRWPSAPRPSKPATEMDRAELAEYKALLKEWLDIRRLNYPIMASVPNPKNLFWDASCRHPNYIFEEVQRPVVELAARFPEIYDNLDGEGKYAVDSGDANVSTTWREYWDDEYVSYFVGGEPVKVNGEEFINVPHGYGFCPYDAEFTTFGYSSAQGKPEERIRGLLYYVHGILAGEAEALTYRSAIMRSVAMPTEDVKYPFGKYSAEQLDEMVGGKIGEINYVPNDVEHTVNYPRLPQGGPWRDEVELYRGYAHEATVNPVLSGVRPLGSSSGFDTSLTAAFARNKTKAVVFPLQRLLQKFNEHCGMLVQNRIADRVTVWAFTPAEEIDEAIEPADFKNHFTNYVRMNATSFEERIAQAHLGESLYLRGLISRKLAKSEYAGVPNPYEDDKQMAAERFMDGELMQKFVEFQAATELGMLTPPFQQFMQTGQAVPPPQVAPQGPPSVPADGLPFGRAQGMPPDSSQREFQSPRAAAQVGSAQSLQDIDILRNNRQASDQIVLPTVE